MYTKYLDDLIKFFCGLVESLFIGTIDNIDNSMSIGKIHFPVLPNPNP